jgi:hypothetical protein
MVYRKKTSAILGTCLERQQLVNIQMLVDSAGKDVMASYQVANLANIGWR